MKTPLRLALVGDYHPDIVAHQAIPLAIDDAAAVLEQPVKYDWLATPSIASGEALAEYDAVWVVPGSPYRHPEGAFTAIRYARENSIPFLGTCGGFQHAVIEYARNVLGWQDAGHAETDSEGRMVIAPLSCSLVETSAVVELRANTLIARAYGRESIEEGYHCRYGVDSAFAAELEQGDLRVTGWDEEGEIRAVELVTHPFFVATLFQHERHALDGRPRRWCRRFFAPRHNNPPAAGAAGHLQG
jgi:CTP synthase (UTP-ammonia lyase)